MPKYRDVACYIRVGGEPCTEYNLQTSEDGQDVTCHIIAENNVPFDLQLIWPTDVHARLDMNVWIDGLRQMSYTDDSGYVCKNEAASPRHGLNSFDFRKLWFAPIVLKTGKDINWLENRPEVLEQMGTIVVQLWRALPSIQRVEPNQYWETMPNFRFVSFKPVFTCPGEFSESQLQNSSLRHRVNFGYVRNEVVPKFVTRKLDPVDKPFITLTFYYRTREHVESEGHVLAKFLKVDKTDKKENMALREEDGKEPEKGVTVSGESGEEPENENDSNIAKAFTRTKEHIDQYRNSVEAAQAQVASRRTPTNKLVWLPPYPA